MSAIDQKKYLKKYLGIGKGSGEKKKKKKPKKTAPSRFKIVDADAFTTLSEEIKVDLEADNEDAPQIVSIIDDRPPSLRVDEVSKNHLWTPIGAPSASSSELGLKFEGKLELSKPKEKSKRRNLESRDFSPPRGNQCSSPLRRVKKDRNEESSSEIKIKKEPSDEDYSPPRRQRRKSSSPEKDISPPRRNPKRVSVDSDSSPPRRSIKREKSEDNSPPRRSKPSTPLSTQKDLSPLRPSFKRERSEDISPPRRKRDRSTSPSSTKTNFSSSGRSHRRRSLERDMSPPRHRDKDKTKKKSRWGDDKVADTEADKLKKTLDGKKAGLQNAMDLVEETRKLKKREDELFKSMSAEVSGANATTVVRRKKKQEVDWEEEERKRKKEEENKEKYNKWGKGLKQVEDSNQKLQEEMYEMTKPLARYADDEDLEKYLKEQEREGDPMLAYIRQKKKKKLVEEGKPVTQQYQGDAPPNRFGIRPGYRWDGVDRSNGYEKRWFEVQNARQASIEESYKWSTEDM